MRGAATRIIEVVFETSLLRNKALKNKLLLYYKEQLVTDKHKKDTDTLCKRNTVFHVKARREYNLSRQPIL